MSEWTYNGETVTDEMSSKWVEDGFIGFVYIITVPDGRMYVGKKLIVSKRKMKPLKGKTRKRSKMVETNWREYWGSGDEVPRLLEEHSPSDFKREVIHLCKTKGEMSYKELVEQMDRRVLESSDYLNGIIQVRIHRNHIPKQAS